MKLINKLKNLIFFILILFNIFYVYSLDTGSWNNYTEKEIKKLKEINFVIHNISEGFYGSGSHIKINNKSYILTCSHLSNKNKSIITAEDNDGKYYFCLLKKIDRKNDLALYEINFNKKFEYIDISNEKLKVSSYVYAIGNSKKIYDKIKDGIIIDINDNYIRSTNKISFGDSGGALIYKNKLIGVVIQIETQYKNNKVFAISVPLFKVKKFLKDIQ